ncbi:kinase [Solibacillus silvestris]|uniref:kinase n=1 Tax=Solibacillus silvestris TaxID=76853 RepID=UPI003F7D956C
MLLSLVRLSDILLTQLKKTIQHERPFIVGIDGLGGAGKTTFVEKLSKVLSEKGYDVATLHIDDYIVESDKRYNTGYEEWHEYYFLQWDIKLLQTELFQSLYDGRRLMNLPLYDKTADNISAQKLCIAPLSIVLIEGVFIQRREWREYFDFVIFLECPQKERENRVLNRDLYIGDYQHRLNKYERRYWIAEEYYVKMENPKGKADVIYNSFGACSSQLSEKNPS